MLIKLSVENYKSFDQKVELSMLSSSKLQGNKAHRLMIKQTKILKNAVIYGANASGKSNLVSIFTFIKNVLIEGLTIKTMGDFCRNKDDNKNRPSVFELQFTVKDKFYAYGFSAILSQSRITEEWLYELMQDGSAHQLFIRENSLPPVLGENIRLASFEKNRFKVYSEDFINRDSELFLTEMNRGKKYEDNSKLKFFSDSFNAIIKNIVVISPNMGLSNTDSYYNFESLEHITKLIQTFDTGITNLKTKQITLNEMSEMMPFDVLQDIFEHMQNQMQTLNLPTIEMTWRAPSGFLNIKLKENEEPIITTLILKHGNSNFDFSFSDESDGTKRLFDLIDMILTNKNDTVFIVDELERSLHPKLTEHFLKLFMKAHEDKNIQLVFTTHEDTIMNQDLFRRDEIWFMERDINNSSIIYSLDRFKERYDKKLNKAYLEGRYGAIPIFDEVDFQ